MGARIDVAVVSDYASLKRRVGRNLRPPPKYSVLDRCMFPNDAVVAYYRVTQDRCSGHDLHVVPDSNGIRDVRSWVNIYVITHPNSLLAQSLCRRNVGS